jgi:hypothetical protein
MARKKGFHLPNGTPQSSISTMEKRSLNKSMSIYVTPTHKMTSSSGMEGFVIPRLTKPECANVNKRFVELLVDAALPMSLGYRDSFKRFIEAVRPGLPIEIANYYKATQMLHELAKDAVSNIEGSIASLLGKGHFSGILIDTWQNISKVPIEGVLLKAGTKTFALESLTANSEHHGISVARDWEILVRQRISTDNQFRYFLSDDAGQCSCAQKFLHYASHS